MLVDPVDPILSAIKRTTWTTTPPASVPERPCHCIGLWKSRKPVAVICLRSIAIALHHFFKGARLSKVHRCSDQSNTALKLQNIQEWPKVRNVKSNTSFYTALPFCPSPPLEGEEGKENGRAWTLRRACGWPLWFTCTANSTGCATKVETWITWSIGSLSITISNHSASCSLAES